MASNTRTKRAASRRKEALRHALRRENCDVAVFRKGFRVYVERISRPEAVVLGELRRGGTLPSIFGRTLRKSTAIGAPQVQSMFQRFTALGWIALPQSSGKRAS